MGKNYTISQDVAARILSSSKTNEEQLNRASLIIMQQWSQISAKIVVIYSSGAYMLSLTRLTKRRLNRQK